MSRPTPPARSGRWLLLVALVGLAGGFAGGYWWTRNTPAQRPVDLPPPGPVQALDPVQDLGLSEHRVDAGGNYTFVYVVENSPGALAAMPLYGETPRPFTFNPDTRALFVSTPADLAADTRLVVGYEAVVADFLLDAQFLHTREASLQLPVRPRSMLGQVVRTGGETGPVQELVRNAARPLGAATVVDLGRGRVRVTWQGAERELAPGESWLAPGKGAANGSGGVAFVNYGPWPLRSVTVMR